VAEIITDAELVSKFAEQAMKEPEKIVETRAPSASEVELPGGYITFEGKLITTAEVRELTGADEEAIAKAGSTAKSLHVLLERGLVKIGDKEATKDDIDLLLSGDRDAILLGIRRVTFGESLDLKLRCPSCNVEQQSDVHLLKDVPFITLKDRVNDRHWVVQTKSGPVELGLPTGVVQKKLMENTQISVPEVNTILLAGCINTINGQMSVGTSGPLSLGMSDRSKIIDSILEKNPGPRLGEVKKVCKACEEEIQVPLSLVDLFRL
jgi:hypothetical protein